MTDTTVEFMTDTTIESISTEHGEKMYKLGLEYGGFTKLSDAIAMLNRMQFETADDAILALYNFRAGDEMTSEQYAADAKADHKTSEAF